MAGGSVAVFVREVEAGPVAMLGIGALLLLIGLAGVLPTKLKFGDNELEFVQEKVSDALVTMVELVPPERREKALELLRELVPVAPKTATAALRGLAFEDLVHRMLEDSVAEINDGRNSEAHLRVEEDVIRGGRQFDAVITASEGHALVVESKGYTKPIGPTMIKEAEARAKAFEPQGTQVLLVTRSRLTAAAKEYLGRPEASLLHVRIDSEEDQRKLTDALRQALAS
jgi:hypothetical protein